MWLRQSYTQHWDSSGLGYLFEEALFILRKMGQMGSTQTMVTRTGDAFRDVVTPSTVVGIHENQEPGRWERSAQPWEVLGVPIGPDSFRIRKLFLGTPNCILYRENLGVSPGAFMRQLRVHALRRTLVPKATGESTVTDLAYHLGFTELRRLARDYRRAFGEVPSPTLARSFPGDAPPFWTGQVLLSPFRCVTRNRSGAPDLPMSSATGMGLDLDSHDEQAIGQKMARVRQH